MFALHRLWFLAAALCLVFAMVSPAAAQDTGAQQIPSADLKKAATAYKDIQVLYNELQQSLQEIDSQEKRMELQENTNQLMVQAVKDTGLGVDDYNDVMRKVREDKETAERFTEELQISP